MKNGGGLGSYDGQIFPQRDEFKILKIHKDSLNISCLNKGLKVFEFQGKNGDLDTIHGRNT